MKSFIFIVIALFIFSSTSESQIFKFEKKIEIFGRKISEFSVSAKNNTPWILTAVIDGEEYNVEKEDFIATGESFKRSVVFEGDRCETIISFNAYTKDGSFFGSTKDFTFKKKWKDGKNFSKQIDEKDIK